MTTKKKIISFRLPPDQIKALGAKAAKFHVSRNKLVELLLRDYFASGDKALAEIVQRPEVLRDDKTVDMFA